MEDARKNRSVRVPAPQCVGLAYAVRPHHSGPLPTAYLLLGWQADPCSLSQRGTNVVDMVHGDVAGEDSPRAQPLVLIVEDDQSTRMLYKEYLTDAGFRTIEAHNGFQAFEKAQTHHPDAVLTDLAVPGMDGFEFCRALRASATTKDVPIVAITGYPDYLANPERIRQAGITRVMTKPCNLENIVRELRRLLNGQATT